MAIRYWHDLYPADDPRDGTRVVRFTHHQKAHYEGVRNGAGSGLVELRGTTSDAQLIAPTGMQYVRVVEENTVAATETVRGGYFLEEGDFLALDRKRLKKLQFGGTGTLSYLDREVMWSHSYAHGIVSGFVPQDPFDGIWRLWNQGEAMGGDKLGAILWRVIKEGQAYRSGATYTHRHATGDEFNVEFTDAHDDDKLETAIPFVTLGFTQFVDSSGNAWTVGSGEFEAQVGESLFEVTKRLMDAGLYVELDPDTFELRAWEVANHGRDRTGLAWGADVVRFEPPPPPSTDRAEGNILNDLKRALKPFIKVTAVLAGGGEDTYAVATASGVVPWHRFRPLDINDTTALSAAATRDITRRNDAGDTVLVRSKVGNDPANGYYLPEEHAKLDDLVTVHSGTDTWDWDEAAYPIAKWSVTSRRTGAPDVFYHLGASYHAGASKEFAGGAGVGKHTHPPNPRLCMPDTLAAGESEVQAFYWDWSSGAEPVAAIPSLGQAATNAPNSAHGTISTTDGPDGLGYYTGNLNQANLPANSGDYVAGAAAPGDVIRLRWSQKHGSGSADPKAFGIRWVSGAFGTFNLLATETVSTSSPGWTAVQRDFVAPPGTTGFYVRLAGTALRVSKVSAAYVTAGAGGTLQDGHPDLVGTGPRTKRCDATEHVFRDRVPSTSDNRSAGYKQGTHWVYPQGDGTARSWMLEDQAAGTWVELGGGASGTTDAVTRTDGTDDVTYVADAGSAHSIEDPTANVQDITLSQNSTLTLPAPSDGKFFYIRLHPNGYDVTWDSVAWPGDPPSLSDSGTDLLYFVSTATEWLGSFVGTEATGTHDHDADYAPFVHSHGSSSGGLPLTAVVNGEPVLLWDENNSLIGAA